MVSLDSVTTAMTFLLLLEHFSACLSLVQSIISSDSSLEVWSFTLGVLARPDCQMLPSNSVTTAMTLLLLLEHISAHLFLVQRIIISSDSSMEIWSFTLSVLGRTDHQMIDNRVTIWQCV